MFRCQGIIGLDGGAEVLKLVVPAPVDGIGDVESSTDLGVSVSCDEILVVVPRRYDFWAGADAELSGRHSGAFSDPESVVGANDAFVGGVDLHVRACAAGQGAVVAGGGVGCADWAANEFLPQCGVRAVLGQLRHRQYENFR